MGRPPAAALCHEIPGTVQWTAQYLVRTAARSIHGFELTSSLKGFFLVLVQFLPNIALEPIFLQGPIRKWNKGNLIFLAVILNEPDL